MSCGKQTLARSPRRQPGHSRLTTSRSTSTATPNTSPGSPSQAATGDPQRLAGEYQTLTDEERANARDHRDGGSPGRLHVIPAVGAYGAREPVRWAEQAAEAGASAVMALPPNSYRADERSVVEHYRALAAVGLPVIAYNNPLDTKVDLGPRLLARLHQEGLIVAVKEFAGDPRRAYAIRELAPELDVLAARTTPFSRSRSRGPGWISGYTSAFPRSCIELYRASMSGDLDDRRTAYRALHALLRWDSKTEFVQAIKLSMDIVGRTADAAARRACRAQPRARGRGAPADRAGAGRRYELRSIWRRSMQSGSNPSRPNRPVTWSASSASHRRRRPRTRSSVRGRRSASGGPRCRRPVSGAGGGRERAPVQARRGRRARGARGRQAGR